MNENEQKIKSMLENLGRQTPPADIHDIAEETARAFLKKVTKPSTTGRWRCIMKRRITRLSAAAAVIIAVGAGLVMMLLNTTTYALEQTLQANRSVRTIHMKFEPVSKNSVAELWAEFDENSQLQHMRYIFPESDEGPKDIVWQNDKAQAWYKKRKILNIFHEKDMLEKIRLPYELFDPKLIVENIYKDQAEGRVQIETQEPPAKGGPIILTVTSKESNLVRKALKVDPDTKLVQEYEEYLLKDNQYVLKQRLIYLEYNQPFDPEIFILNPPDDVVRIDSTSPEIGLAQGDMTAEEVAVELVRQFFTALFEENYAEAGRLMGGIPADKMRRGDPLPPDLKVRIVSIGEPTGHPQTGGLQVPIKIEFSFEGKIEVMEEKPVVRQVYGQPGRWVVIGGF